MARGSRETSLTTSAAPRAARSPRIPSPTRIRSALISSAFAPSAAVARNVPTLRLGEVDGARIGLEQAPGPFGDALEHGVKVDGGRQLPSHLRESSHLVAAPARLLVELRVRNRGADAGGDRREQAHVGFAEPAGVDGALHADDTEGPLSRHDRHAEKRLGGDAQPARPEMVEVLCPVEQQGRAGLEDARGQPLAEGDRRRSDPLAELAVEGKLDRVCRRVVQGDVHDVGVERLAHLLAHELDQRREVELPRQRVTDAVDDRQLGGALPRFVQQPGPLQSRGDVLADERQQLLVLLRVADVLGVALHDEDAERPPSEVSGTPSQSTPASPTSSTSPRSSRFR